MKRQLYMGGGIMNLSKEGIGGGNFRGIDMAVGRRINPEFINLLGFWK